MRKILQLGVAGLVIAACGQVNPDSSEQKVIYGKTGQPLPDSQVNSSQISWRIMSSRNAEDLQFKSVGSWSGMCSATLVSPPNIDAESIADHKAYILTNGHCIKIDPKAVIVNQKSRGTFSLNMFQDAASSARVKISATQIRYSTMNNTDFALIELNKTYAEIAALGYEPIALTAQKPAVGTTIINVGIPQSGITSVNRYLRRSDCKLQERVMLQEGNFIFSSAIRNQCSVIGGSSGSPLLSQAADGTLTFVAILNTGTSYQSKLKACAQNNPCEIDAAGNKTTQLFNYGQDIYQLASCFSSEGFFDLSLSSCTLPKPQA